MSVLKQKKTQYMLLISLIGLLVMAILWALTKGSVKIPISDVVEILKAFLTRQDYGDLRASHVFIVTEVRMPRIILSALVGGILSVIGASFQAIFKNPMADPYVMGVSSGAAFGATLAIVLGLGSGLGIIGLSGISLMAFVGALSTVFIVYNLARHGQKVSTISILLAGIVINAILSACISMMMLFFQNDMDRIITWTMGSFNSSTWNQVYLLTPVALLGLVFLLSQSRTLNAMVMGEEEAKTLGVNVERVKKMTLGISSLLAAFAVSMSGIIGFVGLIVPHFFRMLLGPNHKMLIPASFVGGAIFLLACDTMARSLIENMEIPVGIITAILGGPFFLVLLQKHKRKLI